MTGHVYNITDVDHKECVLHTQLYVNETERPKLHKETGPLSSRDSPRQRTDRLYSITSNL